MDWYKDKLKRVRVENRRVIYDYVSKKDPPFGLIVETPRGGRLLICHTFIKHFDEHLKNSFPEIYK